MWLQRPEEGVALRGNQAHHMLGLLGLPSRPLYRLVLFTPGELGSPFRVLTREVTTFVYIFIGYILAAMWIIKCWWGKDRSREAVAVIHVQCESGLGQSGNSEVLGF